MNSFIILILTSSSLVLAQSDGSEPRFSIGLGVLAPSYSQKLDGNGRLDVNQDKSGFSYSLNNVVHPSSSGSSLQNDHKVSQKVLISKLSSIQDLKNKLFLKVFIVSFALIFKYRIIIVSKNLFLDSKILSFSFIRQLLFNRYALYF
jgi:hypothetical protein